jgi:hypothetical protein
MTWEAPSAPAPSTRSVLALTLARDPDQAKVLDRRERLESEIGNLEDVFGHEHLHQMVGSVRDIRALLRVKMEDSNDLQVRQHVGLDSAEAGARRRASCGVLMGGGGQMAEDTIRSTHFFFSTLTRYAKDKEQPEYAALETLRAL